jgi:gamma-glutamylcyclotransferase
MAKYFAYGSNLLPNRLEERVGSLTYLRNIVLHNQKINFSKISNDGSGKCTMTPSKGQEAHGALYELPFF